MVYFDKIVKYTQRHRRIGTIFDILVSFEKYVYDWDHFGQFYMK